MCIENRLSQKERTAALAKKPDIIKVWRLLNSIGQSLYAQSCSPRLLDTKIHNAKSEPDRKKGIDYDPGFHCFVTKRAALRRDSFYTRTTKVEVFYVRKQWITEIGVISKFWGSRAKVYVAKKITPDRSLLI